MTYLKTISLGAATAVAVLAGCAPTATSVVANVTAGADLNGGLPAKATIYYLSSLAKFNASDYASLANAPEATLGADLLGMQSVLLSPGDSKQAARSFDGEGPAAVGVVVGFRALSTSQWRASTGVTGGKANALTISIGSGSVSISK